MAVEEVGSGVWDASVAGVGTFDLVAQGFDPGTYVLRMTVANMEAGDELVVVGSISAAGEGFHPGEPKVVATDAPLYVVHQGITAEPVVLPAGGGFVSFSANQTTGTARTYEWLLVRIF